MAVPLLDVPAQNGPLEADLQAAFLRVLQSGRYILGPEVHAFEAEMAADCQVSHGIGVSSGTDALLLALMSLDIGPGDEVLCPAFTFFATAGSIARTGARPVFVDSHKDTFNMDVDDAAQSQGSQWQNRPVGNWGELQPSVFIPPKTLAPWGMPVCW